MAVADLFLLALAGYVSTIANGPSVSEALTRGTSFSFTYNAAIMYGEAMSPFFMWSFWDSIVKHRAGDRPDVLTGITILGVAYLLSGAPYWHFAYDGFAFLMGYLVLTELGYSKAFGFAGSVWLVISADQLWQVPWYFWLTLQGPFMAAKWIMVAGWALMAVPLFVLYVAREAGTVELDVLGGGVLVMDVILTVYSAFVYGPGSFPYYLYTCWLAFFPLLARSSMAAGRALHNA